MRYYKIRQPRDWDDNYLHAVQGIMDYGIELPDRTGVGCHFESLVFDFMPYDNNVPALNSKFMPVKSTIEELFWMLRGSVDVTELQNVGVRWWDSWVREDGTIGPGGYGNSLRNRNGHDQLETFLEGIVRDPFSRRHIMTTWWPEMQYSTTLPPCHGSFVQANFGVDGGDGKKLLVFSVTQRSGDMALGVPINVMMWFYFARVVAEISNSCLVEFSYVVNNAHVYKNHFKALREQTLQFYDYGWSMVEDLLGYQEAKAVIPESLTVEKFLSDLDKSAPSHSERADVMRSYRIDFSNPGPKFKMDVAV